MKSRMKEADEVYLKTQDNFVNLLDRTASYELASLVELAFQEVQEGIFPVCAMHKFAFCGLVEDDELSHAEFLA